MDFDLPPEDDPRRLAVQRNIVAEHVLGLRREPNVQQGRTWAETMRARSSTV